MSERTGTFDLYKGRKLAATVTLTRGQFSGVKPKPVTALHMGR